MKVKNLLLMALAIVSLSSCKKESVSEPNTISGDIKLRIALPGYSDINRATLDNYVAGGTKTSLNTVEIYLLDASKNVIRRIELDKTKFKALQSNDGYIIEKANGVASVSVVVNGNAPAQPGDNEELVKSNALDGKIANIQPSPTAPGVSNVTMYGNGATGPVQKDGKNEINPATGNTLYAAPVTVHPLIARVQVYGKVATKANVGNFKVTKIFLDNFKATKGQEADEKTHLYTTVGIQDQTGVDGWIKNYNFFDVAADGLPALTGTGDAFDKNGKSTGNGVYAYHLFPQEGIEIQPIRDGSVKLILEMTYTDEAKDAQGKAITHTKYQTLRLATATGDVLDKTALNIDAASAYTIDLGKIDWTGDGKYDKNDTFNPIINGTDKTNEKNLDLSVIVKVQEWKLVPLIPGV